MVPGSLRLKRMTSITPGVLFVNILTVLLMPKGHLQ